MKTITSTKATTNTALVVATLALIAVAALAWGSANFAVLTNTPNCGQQGSYVISGVACCSGLHRVAGEKGDLCAPINQTCAITGQMLGPSATIKCCSGLTLQKVYNEGSGYCEKYICIGVQPANSTICQDDFMGLYANTSLVLVGSCTTTRKCEYACNPGYVKSGNICVPICVASCTDKCGGSSDGCGGTCTNTCPVGQYCQSGACKKYICTGTPPANSVVCQGDDIGLPANIPLSFVSSCTTTKKCEYVCKPGFVKSGNTCVPICLAVCTGKCGGASDGCGGACNAACPTGQTCKNGTCVCAPSCTNSDGSKKCFGSSDGCGGKCWGCPDDTYVCGYSNANSNFSCMQNCTIGASANSCGTSYCPSTNTEQQCYAWANSRCTDFRGNPGNCTSNACKAGSCWADTTKWHTCSKDSDCWNIPNFSAGDSESYVCRPEYPGAATKYCIRRDQRACNSAGQCTSFSSVCTPNCTGKTCGDDGCGGSCGTCPVGQSCSSGACLITCSSPSYTCPTGYICIKTTSTATSGYCMQQCYLPYSYYPGDTLHDWPCGYVTPNATNECRILYNPDNPYKAGSAYFGSSGGAYTVFPQSTSYPWILCPGGCINNSSVPNETDHTGVCGAPSIGGDMTPPVVDSTSPAKQILISGNSKVTVFVVKLGATSAEALDLKEVKITDVAAGKVASNYYLYSSVRSDGKAVTDPIAIAPGGKIADFMMPANTVVIPASGNVVLTVKIDVGLIDGITITNGTNFLASVAANTDIKATGKSSGQEITINNAPIVRASGPDVAYASRPYFSVNAASPSGTLVPGVNSLIAIFNVKADDADDVTFINTAGNYLKIDIASSNIAGLGNFIIRDETGTTLDSGINVLGGQLYFDFDLANFIISKGMTKKLYLYGNTSTLNVNDTLQAYLSDTGTNLGWSINYNGGNYSQTDIIFRNGIYAGALKV